MPRKSRIVSVSLAAGIAACSAAGVAIATTSTTTHPVTLCLRNGSVRVAADGTCSSRETKVQVASAADVAALASRLDGVEADAAAHAQDNAVIADRLDALTEIAGCNIANLPPTLASDVFALPSEPQDTGAPVGAVGITVSSWIATLYPSAFGDGNDASGCALRGIAVTAADMTRGTWYFSLDNGGVWTSFGSPTASSALLLPGKASLYFQPNPGFNGTDSFTFLAWDRTTGISGGSADTAGGGAGTSAFSGTSAVGRITVTAAT